MPAGRPRLYDNVDQMNKIVDKYFKDCKKDDRPYTMSGLAHALGMDRRSLINYSDRDEFFLTIKCARERVEQQLEENALGNKSNAVFTIFNLKNNFGWKDTTEVKVDEESSKLDELIEALKDVKKDN